MRPQLAVLSCLLLACTLGAGEAIPPGAARLVEDANSAVAKARQAYDLALQKERDRLAAALAKEQDRETRAGNLDTALAIKALIAEVKAGRRPAAPAATAPVTSDDLLGEEPAPASAMEHGDVHSAAPAVLVIDKPAAVVPAVVPGEGPEAILGMLPGTVMISIPKGDATSLVCTITAPGLVVAQTGSSEANNAEIWAELQQAGFKQESQGNSFTWFTLQAKPGMKFPFHGSPRAGYPVQLFAKAITPGR